MALVVPTVFRGEGALQVCPFTINDSFIDRACVKQMKLVSLLNLFQFFCVGVAVRERSAGANTRLEMVPVLSQQVHQGPLSGQTFDALNNRRRQRSVLDGSEGGWSGHMGTGLSCFAGTDSQRPILG